MQGTNDLTTICRTLWQLHFLTSNNISLTDYFARTNNNEACEY